MSNQLKAPARSIADLVVNSGAQVDAGTGTLPALDSLWEQSLQFSNNLTMDQCKAYHEHRTNFLAGLNQGVGELGFPVFQANKDMLSLTAHAPILDDTAAVKIHRHRAFPIPGQDGKVADVYGGSEMKFSVRGAENVGQLKTSRQDLKAMYSALAD